MRRARNKTPGELSLPPGAVARFHFFCPPHRDPWGWAMRAALRAERPTRIWELYPPRMRGAVSRITSGGMEVRGRWANMRRPTGLSPPGAAALFSFRPTRALGARPGRGAPPGPWTCCSCRVLRATPQAERPARMRELYPPSFKGVSQIRRALSRATRPTDAPTGLGPPGGVLWSPGSPGRR